MLDVRGNDEWTKVEDSGTNPQGHIPGSVHLIWTDVIQPDSK